VEVVNEVQNKPVYWDLPETAKLFGFNYDEGCNVYNGLVERCELLRGVLRRPKGFKSIIQHSNEPLSENQVFQIKNKCIFLLRAYEIALQKMGTTNTRLVKDCCQVAVDQVNGLGFNTTINAKTLSYCNIDFRKRGKFAHPNPFIANGIKPKPPLFEYFPKAAVDATTFVLDHLDHFAVEMLHNEFITTIIPALKAEVENSGGNMNRDHPDYNLLCHYSNNPPSYMTVLRWVHYLGFKQNKFKKWFYVDGDEHLSQILHWSRFTMEYLTNRDPCSHCWVQIAADEYQTLISSLPDKDTPLSRVTNS
jgi:hypothetical protein